MLPTLSPWGTIAYFKLNRDYIAKVLCENRARPEMHCNGQCYLAKKLKQQQEKQDKETSEKVQNTPVIQLFTSPFHSYIFEALPAAFPEKIPLFPSVATLYCPSREAATPAEKMNSEVQ
jgi:hypothetical protein